MYIKNNMFDNIFNTVMGMKGKAKDNIKARMNIVLFCNCKNMRVGFWWVMGRKALRKLCFREEYTTTSLSMAYESALFQWTCLEHIKVG